MRLMGLPLPGDGGDRFFPEGYKIAEVGPRRLGKGVLPVDRAGTRKGREGCPFG